MDQATAYSNGYAVGETKALSPFNDYPGKPSVTEEALFDEWLSGFLDGYNDIPRKGSNATVDDTGMLPLFLIIGAIALLIVLFHASLT